MATWLAAWDGFAVGAAIVGMMPYKAAVRHKLTVQVNTACDMYVPVMGVRCFSRYQEVVCLAVAGGRKPIMAVLYDELLRKEWEELSARKHSFDVASVVGVVNDKVCNACDMQVAREGCALALY